MITQALKMTHGPASFAVSTSSQGPDETHLVPSDGTNTLDEIMFDPRTGVFLTVQQPPQMADLLQGSNNGHRACSFIVE